MPFSKAGSCSVSACLWGRGEWDGTGGTGEASPPPTSSSGNYFFLGDSAPHTIPGIRNKQQEKIDCPKPFPQGADFLGEKV